MSTSVDSTGTATAPASSTRLLGWALALVAVLAVIGLAGSMLLWQKLGNIQQALAQQSQDAGRQAIEARALARQASELAQESSARLAVQERG